MYNLLRICNALCEPIFDPSYTKLHLIDVHYLTYTHRLDIHEDTCIKSDKETTDKYKLQWKAEHPNHPPPNFVTEIFFLTLLAQHYGLVSLIRSYQNIQKSIDEIKMHIRRMQMGLQGPQAALNDAMLKRFQVISIYF